MSTREVRQQQLSRLYFDWAVRTGRDPDYDDEFHRQAMAIVTGGTDQRSDMAEEALTP